MLRRYAAVFEPACRRRRHAQTEFSLDILRAKPASILLHDESAYLPVVVLRPDHFHVRYGRVANPAFAPIQYIMSAIACGAGLHAARIGTVPMLRQRETTDAFARHQSGQP